MDIKKYLSEYDRLITSDSVIEKIPTAAKFLKQQVSKGGSLLLFGNGASATIASHAALDFTKQAKLKSYAFNDSALLTAYSNDYGFDNSFSRLLDSYGNENDVVIGISVSGTSSNIVELFKKARHQRLTTISFTGKSTDNPVRLNSEYSFWVDSHAYNIVESVHHIWLTSIIDCVIGKSIYSVTKI